MSIHTLPLEHPSNSTSLTGSMDTSFRTSWSREMLRERKKVCNYPTRKGSQGLRTNDIAPFVLLLESKHFLCREYIAMAGYFWSNASRVSRSPMEYLCRVQSYSKRRSLISSNLKMMPDPTAWYSDRRILRIWIPLPFPICGRSTCVRGGTCKPIL